MTEVIVEIEKIVVIERIAEDKETEEEVEVVVVKATRNKVIEASTNTENNFRSKLKNTNYICFMVCFKLFSKQIHYCFFAKLYNSRNALIFSYLKKLKL